MPDAPSIRAGTRDSRLALWQTEHVIARLAQAWPELSFERVRIRTLGDRITDVPLPRIGDRGLFTRELEDALRSGAIDFAVHSLKDLPTEQPDGLALGAVLSREDPSDVLISRHRRRLADLPPGARLGTSSLRRRAQVMALRRDLDIVDIRGNVPTRIEKVERGEYDATLLALAGLRRLELTDVATEVFGSDVIVPAPGQGALAVQVRADDARILRIVAAVQDLEDAARHRGGAAGAQRARRWLPGSPGRTGDLGGAGPPAPGRNRGGPRRRAPAASDGGAAGRQLNGRPARLVSQSPMRWRHRVHGGLIQDARELAGTGDPA